MPLRVQGLFYQMMPSQFPLPMRSVARFFFGKAKEKTVDPRLEANVAFVCTALTRDALFCAHSARRLRSTYELTTATSPCQLTLTAAW